MNFEQFSLVYQSPRRGPLIFSLDPDALPAGMMSSTLGHLPGQETKGHEAMNTRSPAVLVSLILLFTACTSSEQAKHEVEKVVIHFMPWDLESYRAMTCDDIRNSPDSVVIAEGSDIRRLIDAVADSKQEQLVGRQSIDARICCDFINKEHNVHRNVAFGIGAAMQFDGIVYQLDEELLHCVESCLPADYRSM
jgi:hypothetical protein